MIVALCLIAAVLPWTLVEGRKGCWAGSTAPGQECLYDTVIPGSPGLEIRYRFTSEYSRICCEALRCSYWRGCQFTRVGCGQSSTPFETRPLTWDLSDVEPIMRCYDSRGSGAYYSYTVIVGA